MRTDTLHFGSDMLGIAGTPAIPTQDHLPLASEGCNQLVSYLQDKMRRGGQLLDNSEMLRNRFRDVLLYVHTRDPFFHTVRGTLSGIRGDEQTTIRFGWSATYDEHDQPSVSVEGLLCSSHYARAISHSAASRYRYHAFAIPSAGRSQADSSVEHGKGIMPQQWQRRQGQRRSRWIRPI